MAIDDEADLCMRSDPAIWRMRPALRHGAFPSVYKEVVDGEARRIRFGRHALAGLTRRSSERAQRREAYGHPSQAANSGSFVVKRTETKTLLTSP